MATHENNLTAVLREHELLAGFVVASDGSTLCQIGDAHVAEAEGLMSALVGPYGDPQATFDSLDRQLLPRIWRQGDCFAFVDKPSAELMVIVFGRRDLGVDHYQLSKLVSETIREKWRTSSEAAS